MIVHSELSSVLMGGLEQLFGHLWSRHQVQVSKHLDKCLEWGQCMSDADPDNQLQQRTMSW